MTVNYKGTNSVANTTVRTRCNSNTNNKSILT